MLHVLVLPTSSGLLYSAALLPEQAVWLPALLLPPQAAPACASAPSFSRAEMAALVGRLDDAGAGASTLPWPSVECSSL